MVVVDAVVHPYNLAIDNQDPAAKAQLETVYAAHCMSFDSAHAEYALTHEEFFSDVSFETLARVFAKVLGTLIRRCGSDRLMFATGNNLAHPRPILEAFADYQFADEIAGEFDLQPLTSGDRRRILGLNALEHQGLNAQQVLAGITHDEFTRARTAAVPPPWSLLRSSERVTS